MELVRQCCDCRARWEPGRGAAGGRWAPQNVVIPGATHTYCPRCYERAMQALQRYRAARLGYAAGG